MGTIVIAEAGVNHNGSLELARKLVDAAKSAGADIVKFQSFRAEKLVVREAPKAKYQISNTGSEESQYDMLKKLELSDDDHFALLAYCKQQGIEFLSTPFDIDGIEFLVKKVGLKRIKIPSGEITNAPFLLAAARMGLPILLSTGMSTLEEVELALQIVAFGYTNASEAPSPKAFAAALASPAGQKSLREKLILLQCTTEYPAPFSEVNLRAMDTMQSRFGVKLGFSDHTPGIYIPLAAVARGAVLIEKHFTLDRNMPGPDHKASLEPQELKTMIDGIRQVEQSLGDGIKTPSASEKKNISIARKSLVATKPIRKGELFTEQNLGAKRPGSGISPLHYWDYIGKPASRDFQADEILS